MKDTLIIGGHEFNSRFILGSGKFSLEMTKAVIENGGVEMATLALRRAMRAERKIFSTICRKASLFCQTPPAPEPRRKLCVLPAFPGNWAAVIL